MSSAPPWLLVLAWLAFVVMLIVLGIGWLAWRELREWTRRPPSRSDVMM